MNSPDVLCDVHLQKMSRKVYGDKVSLDERTFHVCESEGCARHFASLLGYVDMLNGQLDRTGQACRLCEKSTIYGEMAKAIVRLQDGEPVWECLYCRAMGPDVKGNVRQIA